MPLLNLWSISPTLRVNAPGTGVAGMNEPGWLGSSNSSPPQSSWKSIVSVLFYASAMSRKHGWREEMRCSCSYHQSQCAGILAITCFRSFSVEIGG